MNLESAPVGSFIRYKSKIKTFLFWFRHISSVIEAGPSCRHIRPRSSGILADWTDLLLVHFLSYFTFLLSARTGSARLRDFICTVWRHSRVHHWARGSWTPTTIRKGAYSAEYLVATLSFFFTMLTVKYFYAMITIQTLGSFRSAICVYLDLMKVDLLFLISV